MLVTLLLGGCGTDGDRPSPMQSPRTTVRSTPPPVRLPKLCARVRTQVIGRVASPAATELSGVVLSRAQPGVLWAHNDSGDGARLLAFTTSGRPLAEIAVAGAENDDWEAIAASRDTLYVGDIGDNQARRPSIAVYRLAEPRAAGASADAVAGATATTSATRIDLRYPDGPRDAEALLRDPTSGALVIVEKNYGAQAGVYVADEPTAGAAITMRRSSTMRLGMGQSVTAGDMSADGRTILLRTYDRAFVWRRRNGESLAAALRRKPCAVRANLLAEKQGETAALSSDGAAFYTVPEGPAPPIRRYSTIG